MSKTGFKGGRLGIGTDDPIYPLDVVGDIRLTGGFRDASGNDFNFIALAGPDVVRSSDLADSITGIICKDNCVGIFNNNPSQSLDVSGNIRLTGDLLDANGAARVFSNWTVDGTNIFRNSKVTIGDNSVNTNYSLYVNGHVKFSETNVSKLKNHLSSGTGIWYDYANIQRFIINNEEKMRIHSNGNVGIGTADPGTYKLKVAGSVMIDDYIYHNEGNENTYFGFPGDDTFSIVTGGSTKLTIDQSRAYFNLDIQLPSWIYHKDDTDTKIGFSANDKFQVVVGGNALLHCDRHDTHQLNVNGTSKFSTTATFEGNITASKIGIGAHNSDSSYKLDVWGNARFMNTTYFENSVYFQTSNIYMNSYLVHNGDTDTKIGFPSNDNIYFYCSNTVQMRINHNGVGIHTDAPANSSTRFQVGGNIETTGYIRYTSTTGGLIGDYPRGSGVGDIYTIFCLQKDYIGTDGQSIPKYSVGYCYPGNCDVPGDTNHSWGMYIDGTKGGSPNWDPYANWFLSGTKDKWSYMQSGRLGIGTTEPGEKLQVNGCIKIKQQGQIQHDTTNAYRGLVFENSSSLHSWYMGYRHGGYFTIGNYNTSSYNESVTFVADGKLGIGVTTPVTKLQVAPSGAFSTPSNFTNDGVYISDVSHKDNTQYQTYFAGHSTGSSSPYYSPWVGDYDPGDYESANAVSAYFEAGIMVGGRVFLESDKRIKHDIQVINDTFALRTIREIECYTYFYNDMIRRTPEITFGFLAQEVKEKLPMAVKMKEDFLPAAMTFAEDISWEEIVDDDGNSKFKLIIPILHKDASNNIVEHEPGTKFKFYLTDVSNNINYQDFCVSTLLEDGKSFILEKKSKYVFIYGYLVDDFHILDKEKIFTLHHSAIQELDRQQQADKAKIAELEEKNTELETKVTTLESTLETVLARLTALENTPTE